MPGKESAVDVIAQHLGDDVLLTLVVECKKHNPEFVDWILFSGRTKRQLYTPTLTFLGVSEAEASWRLVRRVLWLGAPEADDARETRGSYGDKKKLDSQKTKTSNSSIADAAYQVALGVQALALEELQRATTLDSSGREYSRDWTDQVFAPLIITTANLKLCEFDANAINASTGEIAYSDVSLSEVPYVILEYGLPRHLHPADVRFENFATDESVEIWSRLQIPVVNSRSLGQFLNSELINALAAK